jgi:3-oxoacyl-[acyl-carrier protein] reductase
VSPEETLAGKVAIVTGGSQGIGKACAAALLDEGAQVMICARTEARVTEATAALADRGRAVGHAADVADRAAAAGLVRATADQLGNVDILVCCHGVLGRSVSFLDTTPEDWRLVIDVNLMGVVNICQAAGVDMAKRGRGTIVTVSSTSGLVADQQLSPYDASKAAVAQLTKCMALELWPLGIRVNGVAPGYVDTDMVSSWLEGAAGKTLGCNITGAAGRPEDIAAVVAFLCSPAAAYVVGAVVPVDGGTMAIHPPFFLREDVQAPAG